MHSTIIGSAMRSVESNIPKNRYRNAWYVAESKVYTVQMDRDEESNARILLCVHAMLVKMKVPSQSRDQCKSKLPPDSLFLDVGNKSSCVWNLGIVKADSVSSLIRSISPALGLMSSLRT